MLFAEEAAGRDRSALATRRAAAGFPTGKTFHAWQPELSSIPAPTQQALRTLEWIGRRENLVVCGPSGTGKTFLLEALGQQAVEAGLHVAWFTLEDLGVLLRRHRADDTVHQSHRPDPARRPDRRRRHRPAARWPPTPPKGSTGSSTPPTRNAPSPSARNLHPAGFDELMPKTLATATVDRLLHHAHVCQTSGDSVRLTQALAGKGVNPLN